MQGGKWLAYDRMEGETESRYQPEPSERVKVPNVECRATLAEARIDEESLMLLAIWASRK